jgi:hypothetical protein
VSSEDPDFRQSESYRSATLSNLTLIGLDDGILPDFGVLTGFGGAGLRCIECIECIESSHLCIRPLASNRSGNLHPAAEIVAGVEADFMTSGHPTF